SALYRARHSGALWFASEVRALLAAGVPAGVRADVLAHAVAYGWAGGSQTPLEGIEVVAPGTVVEVVLERLSARERRWYDPADAVDPERAAALAPEPRERLEGDLDSAARTGGR